MFHSTEAPNLNVTVSFPQYFTIYIINYNNNNNNNNKPVSLGVFNASARHLLADLGSRISINTGEARETSYLFQRISVLVQRFNAVLLHDSLPAADSTD